METVAGNSGVVESAITYTLVLRKCGRKWSFGLENNVGGSESMGNRYGSRRAAIASFVFQYRRNLELARNLVTVQTVEFDGNEWRVISSVDAIEVFAVCDELGFD